MLVFLTIGSLMLLAVVSPGPDFAMITKNALGHSRKAGIYTALGIASAILFHTSYCVLGLAVIISQSLLIFNLIKFIGAGYLIYLGVKTLLNKDKNAITTQQKQKTDLTATQAFRQGFLCNALNPKCIMFFLAIFTMVVKPHTSWSIQALYGVEMFLIAFIWFSALSMMLTHHRVIQVLNKAQKYIIKVMGAFLIGFGISLVAFEHR